METIVKTAGMAAMMLAAFSVLVLALWAWVKLIANYLGHGDRAALITMAPFVIIGALVMSYIIVRHRERRA